MEDAAATAADVPVYEFVCDDCGATRDLLLPHRDAAAARTCDDCGALLRRRFSRVAVKLEGWGFKRTDGLVADRPGGRNDFRAVREKAERIADTGEA